MTEMDERDIRTMAKDLDKDTILAICLKIMTVKEITKDEFKTFLDSQTDGAQKFMFRLMMIRAFG